MLRPLSGVLRRPLLLATIVLQPMVGVAQESLPEPLTLEQALAVAEEPGPELALAQAAVERARARRDNAEADDDLILSLQARARWVDPPATLPDQSSADHRVALVATKPLYDFGRRGALTAAGSAELNGQQQLLLDEQRQRRIRIMERFFDVLVADKQYARENEYMSVVYVNLDRLRQRHAMGQVTDLALSEKEAEYQRARVVWTAAGQRQRTARSRLAIALNRPTSLPSNLVAPELDGYRRSLPDYEPLLELALLHNSRLQAMRSQLTAAENRIVAARSQFGPRLNAEVEAAAYSRELGAYDTWRAGIYLDYPLTSGGRESAAVAAAEAERQAALAELRRGEDALRQSVLDHWMTLDRLRIEQDKVDAERRYRENYLDEKRALYELEVKADLGDAMTRLTDAQLGEMQQAFSRAIAWEQLAALLGVTVAEIPQKRANAEP